MLFDACDLDFDPMILVLKHDLDIIVTHLHTNSEVNRSKGFKVTPGNSLDKQAVLYTSGSVLS